uniref:Death-associated protein 1 n=1 Tax=Esox lucius TaxID=8010 RepID=A0AAY5KAX5_ESOLU
MSSPPKEKIETKGGHLPAVKAGGMRIVQKHQGATPPEPPSNKDKDDEEYVEEPSPPKPAVIVSGVVTKEVKAEPDISSIQELWSLPPVGHWWIAAEGSKQSPSECHQ